MRKFTPVVIAATVALVGASLAGCAPINLFGNTAPNPHHYTNAQIKEYTQEATFHETSFSCQTDHLGLTDTVIHAAPIYGPGSPAVTTDAKRTLTDGISNQLILTSSMVAGYSVDQGNAWCIDPYTALTAGCVVGNFTVPGTDHKVYALEGNGALKKFLNGLKCPEDINNVAETLVFHKGDNLDKYAARNKAFQKYVEALVSIIQQMNPGGIQSPDSVKNWHTEGATAGVPNVLVDPSVDKKRAITYAWSLKNQCLPAYYFGFNLTDQRPEVFNPKDYASICTPTKTTNVCIKPTSPGANYTWVPSKCTWVIICVKPASPGKTYIWVPSECRWKNDSKDGSLIPKDSNGSNVLGADAPQNGTSPGTGVSGNIGVGGNNTGDHGSTVPVQGAAPADPSAPAGNPAGSGAPAPSDAPTTPISNPDQ